MNKTQRALLGSCLLTGTLGSIHAFSVFISPLEVLLGAGRAQVSALYSVALVCLTIAVWGGHHLYRWFAPAILAVVVCLVAALGLLATGFSQNLFSHMVGYSLLFGGANGIGYGLSLYVISQAMPNRTGFGMGTVTAVYALGATLFVIVFEELVSRIGIGPTFYSMAGLLVVIAFAVGWLFAINMNESEAEDGNAPKETGEGSPFDKQGNKGQPPNLGNNIHHIQPEHRLLVMLWFGYGFGVVAGLMAIGHAAGLVEAAGGSTQQVVTGAMLIGIGNALGGFTAGWLVDRVSPRLLLLGLSLLSAFVLGGLTLRNNIPLTFGGLTIIGLAYGAIIAVYPATTVTYYGAEAATKQYGRIFTAWGVAGLLGPWIAGLVYDLTGGYQIALGIACLVALLSTGVVLMLPKDGEMA
ncbi:MAG: MFS transporter [Chloroflexota bacterium]